MTSSFDEHTSVPRNQNADLLIQPRDSDFLRNSPSIEDFDETPLTAKTQSKNFRGFASKLIDEKGLQPRKEGWKLFSPSTWKGLRDTAWGQKKARQRHINRVAKDLKKFMFAPQGVGSPYRWADLWADDPQLATNKAYGMHPDDAQQWKDLQSPGSDIVIPPRMRALRAARKKPVGDGRMGRQSFLNMVERANRPGSESDEGDGSDQPSLQPGAQLDGHAVLEEPGYDPQDKLGNGIPNIWKEMAANPGKWEPKNALPRQLPSGAKGPVGGPHISETDSIEEEIKDDGNVDNGLGMQDNKKHMLEAMYAKYNIVEEVESESSDDDN